VKQPVEINRRFRRRPSEVQAIRVSEICESVGKEHECLLPQWVLDALQPDPETNEGFGAQPRMKAHESHVSVRTKQGQLIDAEWTEWIVCAAPDDLWPVDSDIFDATYEPADKGGHS